MKYRELAKQNPQGFTATTEGEIVNPKRGYAVAIRPLYNERPSTKYIGGWASNGVYYLDEVEIVQTLRQAVKMAVENNQLAVYDFRHQCDINIKDVDKKFIADVMNS